MQPSFAQKELEHMDYGLFGSESATLRLNHLRGNVLVIVAPGEQFIEGRYASWLDLDQYFGDQVVIQDLSRVSAVQVGQQVNVFADGTSVLAHQMGSVAVDASGIRVNHRPLEEPEPQLLAEVRMTPGTSLIVRHCHGTLTLMLPGAIQMTLEMREHGISTVLGAVTE